MPLFLGGCNVFAPAHQGLWAYGSVVEAGTGQPLAGATITVFGRTLESGPGGCVKFAFADGIPFEFDVALPGHKPAVSTPPRGHFHVDVVLQPADEKAASVVTWTASQEEAFIAAPDCG